MIIHELKATPSRLDKEILLAKADTFDKTMFKYAYNPDLSYGLKFNRYDIDSVRPFEQLDEVLLKKILSGKLYGNEARQAVEEHCDYYGDLIKMIINKDLDCGVSVTTLNNVFGKGFIPVFRVQLAKEVAIDKVRVPCIGQIKYNGVRVIALVYHDRVMFKTRNGKIFKYPALAKVILNNDLNNIVWPKFSLIKTEPPFILDGELTIGDSQGTNHTNVSGSVNSSIKTGRPIEGNRYTFNVFDFMPLEEFNSAICLKDYEDRYERCSNIVKHINSDLVKLAETYTFNTHEDIEIKFAEVLDIGYEGLILKHMDHKYSFKRSNDWIKLKDVRTADLKCVEVIEGTGKYEGMIGALRCEGVVDNGIHVEVSVGSGLTDADRSLPWDEFEGKTIEIKYNEVIANRDTNRMSLFLPRFVCVRFDK